ncbi:MULTISPECIES: tripartite tricarboxylate transporter substrate binding protein [Achromobacter]|uniref:Tripartite tricarboxylate transporter substrate binding protein n=1 Tax=Achromobacter denitrificans TaxID=32002 RepID=A0A6N0JGC4_ACHDE|nr:MULTISPECIES: tripartite tricarboxylate transporter substrate binding protein [Achromobacter]MDF3857751.1 tripartite tricarboxylate transporter substrate binding protein [Achromobacter denitrificans]QKQ46135.1 tripartite tricarboxylate transporter substrate binding protein [Achromobacter denitrificans]
MQRTRRRLVAALGALAALPLARTALADTAAWPAQLIRLILPYAAGGPTDVLARAVAQHVARQLGQPVIVENKTGASGNIAGETVARARPDGYTLLYHSSGLAISPALYRQLPYDPVRDFAPVGLTASIPLVLMTANALPPTDTREFIAYLKARPDALSYGTGGVGNITHLSVALFLHSTGTRAVGIPFKGTNPAMVAMLGGQVQFMVDAISSALPYIRDGRVRALAVTGAERSAALPQVPTLREAGLADLTMSTWQGVLAPAATPQPVIQRLNQALTAAVRDPAIAGPFTAQGVDLRSSSPAEFQAYLGQEVRRWGDAVRMAGIQPE